MKSWVCSEEALADETTIINRSLETVDENWALIMSLAFCDSRLLSDALFICREMTLLRSKMKGTTRARSRSHTTSTAYFRFVITLPIFVKLFCL